IWAPNCALVRKADQIDAACAHVGPLRSQKVAVQCTALAARSKSCACCCRSCGSTATTAAIRMPVRMRDMGTLQLEPVRISSSLSYQADLKKLPHLSAKLSAKFYQIVCIGWVCAAVAKINDR